MQRLYQLVIVKEVFTIPKKTDEYDFDTELVQYYGDKVQQLDNVQRFLRHFMQKKRSGDLQIGSSGRYESEEDFNRALNDLLFFAWPKIKKSSNVDVESGLAGDIGDKIYTVDDLDFKQKKRLVYLIRDVFEAFNITSLEREKWETEGIGAVDKKQENKGEVV